MTMKRATCNASGWRGNTVKEFGISTECGWGRADPKRVPGLLASHRKAADLLRQ